MKDSGPARAIRWLFDPRQGATNQFLPRWLFLRAIGLIYFSAFFSLLSQIRNISTLSQSRLRPRDFGMRRRCSGFRAVHTC